MISTQEAKALWAYQYNKGHGEAPGEDRVSDAVEALLDRGGELVIEGEHDCITVLLDEYGALVGVGGDGTGGNAWIVQLVTDEDLQYARHYWRERGEYEKVFALNAALTNDNGRILLAAGAVAEWAEDTAKKKDRE